MQNHNGRKAGKIGPQCKKKITAYVYPLNLLLPTPTFIVEVEEMSTKKMFQKSGWSDTLFFPSPDENPVDKDALSPCVTSIVLENSSRLWL